MGKEKYVVRLQAGRRKWLQATLREGRVAPAVLKRARVLLMADSSAHGPGLSDVRIHSVLGVCESTVHNVRRRFVEEGLAAAVARKPAEGRQYRKLTRKQEDRLVALAQGPAPVGHNRWTLRLLADSTLVAVGVVNSISHECVRATLREEECIPDVTIGPPGPRQHIPWCSSPIRSPTSVNDFRLPLTCHGLPPQLLGKSWLGMVGPWRLCSA